MNFKKDLKRLKQLVKNDSVKGHIDIDDCLIRAAIDYSTTIDEIKEKMMSPEDIEDLKNGDLPFEALKLHIQVWIEMGKPNQNDFNGDRERRDKIII